MIFFVSEFRKRIGTDEDKFIDFCLQSCILGGTPRITLSENTPQFG